MEQKAAGVVVHGKCALAYATVGARGNEVWFGIGRDVGGDPINTHDFSDGCRRASVVGTEWISI